MASITVATSSVARSGRRSTCTAGPRGAHSAGSESCENSTTEGQPAAAIRCIGPVSLPIAIRAPRARLVSLGEVGSAGQVDPHLGIARASGCSGAVPTTTGVRPRSRQHARQVRGSASVGQRLTGRCGELPGTSSAKSLGQGEAGDVAVAPGQIGGLTPVDAGLAKLAELAVDVVQSGCGSGRGPGSAQPWAMPDQSGRSRRRQQLEVAAGAAGGLQVVSPVEPAVDQPPPQPEPAGRSHHAARSSIQTSSNQGDRASQSA